MSRKVARETVYKMLFASKFYDNIELKPDFETLKEVASEGNIIEGDDKDYIQKTFEGVIANLADITNIVMSKIQTYKASRIYPADMVALVLATYELKFSKDIPQKVVINESVNLVKKYSTEKSATFVNGVLSSVLKDFDE